MIVLITGKPNVGKTTIINLLKQTYHVFVADEYIRSIYQANQVGYDLIKHHFGAAYVTPVAVNTTKLSTLIFSQPAMHMKLNNLIWPVLKNKITELKKTQTNYLVELAIYLIDEQHVFADLFDKVIEISADFVTDNHKQKFSVYYPHTSHQHVDVIIKNAQIDQTVEMINDYLQLWHF